MIRMTYMLDIRAAPIFEDDTNAVHPATLRKILFSVQAAIDADIERALYGGYAPVIDPATVVSVQTTG